MNTTTAFAPQLVIDNGTEDISFYKKAFDAIEHFCLRNEDNTVHVAELSIDGAVFHLHEVSGSYSVSPRKCGAVTTIIGLFVTDVDSVMARAVAAGATLLKAAVDYDYGYRQGELLDPFGHRWLIEMKI